MPSHSALDRATSGCRAIGPTTTTSAITGFPVLGFYLLKSDCCGRRDIGASWTASTSGMRVTGDQPLDFMAGLTTDSAIPAQGFTAGPGEATNTITTKMSRT